jgi:hypothetical protein
MEAARYLGRVKTSVARRLHLSNPSTEHIQHTMSGKGYSASSTITMLPGTWHREVTTTITVSGSDTVETFVWVL